LGGEGSISPATGIFYPFVADDLAKQFGAYVLEPEHRFYGKSQPLERYSIATTASMVSNDNHGEEVANEDNGQNIEAEDPRVKLFTPEQALYDAMALLDHVRDDLGCAKDRFSKHYCPVITVGGSYPGFLSAMARIMFPEIVDMAYAASAPMGFYSQEVDRFAYYDHITNVAETVFPGCAQAVRTSLVDVELQILASSSDDLEASSVGVCEGTIPQYITNDDDPNTRMVEELMMVVGYSFAFDNMACYPPNTDTRLYQACKIFSSQTISSSEKVKAYLTGRLQHFENDGDKQNNDNRNRNIAIKMSGDDETCWNMTLQLPSGPNATISSGDWSGVGTGPNGESWDFQTCTLLVEAIGFSKESMFVPRNWSLGWLQEHCMSRFGVKPLPHELVDRWQFNHLVENNVTRILFTNGLKVSFFRRVEVNKMRLKECFDEDSP
jgi:hypothetical protein